MITKITDKERLNYLKKAIERPDLTYRTGMPVHVSSIFKGGPWSLSPSNYQHGHKTMEAAIDAAILIQRRHRNDH